MDTSNLAAGNARVSMTSRDDDGTLCGSARQRKVKAKAIIRKLVVFLLLLLFTTCICD